MRADQSLAEMLDAVLESRLLDVHTSIPGIVQSYDETTQTAVVQPAVRRAIDDTLETLPPIPNVPIAWPSAGGFLIHFPLAAGDGVMLVFSESAWGIYRSSGAVSDPGDLTKHGLSYPVAFPFALRPPTASGARMVCPTPFSFGDQLTEQAVLLETLLTWLQTHTHASPGAPPTEAPLLLPPANAQYLAQKLKA